MGLANEQRYYDALKRIASYQTPQSLRRGAERKEPEWGICYEEALEYAYENVLHEARRATKGRRRPKQTAISKRPKLTAADEAEQRGEAN